MSSASKSPIVPENFLFVCRNGKSRSPTAVAIMKSLLQKKNITGLKIAAASIDDPIEMSPTMIEVLDENGIELVEGCKPVKITQEMIAWADVIFCMTFAQRSELDRDFKGTALKVRMLDNSGIVDPTEDFESCKKIFGKIEKAIIRFF